MIKKLLFALCLLMAYQSQAQVIYLETFDGIPGSTAGGPGTYAFPSNMLLRNVDNLTPDPSVAFVNEAWERREDFSLNLNDSCAISTSWYSPVGTANDFMWTPAIGLPAGQTINLSWQAKAYDPIYPDGYEVRVMTVAPTGGAGVIGNQLSSSTLIFSIAAETNSWVNHTVSLNTYAGQTVYIGFRNNSINQYLLAVDDIKVEVIAPYDASVTAAQINEYTQIPVAQSSLALGGTISNVGSSPLTNVNLVAEVYNSSNVLVYTASSTAVPTMNAGASANFTITPFVPSIADVYTIKYLHTQTETDNITANDMYTVTTTITNNVFARDNGAVTGGVGIGANNGGYFGQSFTLTSPAYLYGITTGYTNGYVGEKYASLIWNTNASGVPQSIIASTDTAFYPSNASLVAFQNIYGGTLLLSPGTYVVTATEFDSTMAVALTDDIFTLGKTWVYWPTSPLGTWGNIEAFGIASFQKAQLIRMNLGSTLFPLASEGLMLNGNASGIYNELSWSNKEQENMPYVYHLERSTDLTLWETIYETSTIGGKSSAKFTFQDERITASKNYYRIQLLEEDKHVKYSNVVLLNQSGSGIQAEVYPNPAKGNFSFHTNQFKNTTLQLIDLQGKIIRTQTITSENTLVSLEGIIPGVYQVQLSSNHEILFVNKLRLE